MRRSQLRRQGWSVAQVALLAAVAGGVVAACSGGEKRSAESAQAAATATSGSAVASGAGTPASVSGQQIFQRCATCHQVTGQGLLGSFPPLAGSEWVTAQNVAVPIRVVLHGLQGPITVKNQRFNSAMPAYGTGQPLSDADVAAVLTYVRSAWGNNASAVTGDQVARERAATASRTTMWTATDLTPLLKAGNR
jgi:mono/diheme cytochrome c family protein